MLWKLILFGWNRMKKNKKREMKNYNRKRHQNLKNLNWLQEKAIETGRINGYKYFILEAPFENALNGYILFESKHSHTKKPVLENGYNGILSYVPVHGGITFCSHSKEGSFYGFDTIHFNSENFPRLDIKWIKSQIEIMLKGILIAKKVEKKYLQSCSNKQKIKYCEMVFNVNPTEEFNMGITLNLLSGRL